MSKGSWIVIGVVVVHLLLFWAYEHRFLEGNVWHERRTDEAKEVQRSVDFLGLHAANYVRQSVGAAFTSLLVEFIYLAGTST